MKKVINVSEVMKKKVFEEISTGGGCYGYFKKKGSKSFYITTPSDQLPELGEQSILGVYDSEFELQYLSLDIKKFDPNKVSVYIEKALKKLNQKIIKEKIKESKNNGNFEIIHI